MIENQGTPCSSRNRKGWVLTMKDSNDSVSVYGRGTNKADERAYLKIERLNLSS